MWNKGPSNVEEKVGHRECRDRVHIEWGEKGEISQEQLFGNSCDSKINKIFLEKQKFWKKLIYLSKKIIAKTLQSI